MQTLKFVIVGHVDHGKSTLIGRLLYETGSLPEDKIKEIEETSQQLGRETEFAYLLDHLEEERSQGITIETTQVFFKTKKREYVIIDAPGHVEFVKNMVTGASQAEAGVLIVDVKEGIREQTKRHSFLLSLLGINQIIVVINKMDLADYSQERFNQLKQNLESFLNSLGLKPLFYLPLSAYKGDNISKKSEKLSWFGGPTFLESLDSLASKVHPESKDFIFPVQDVYKIEDKRIVVGRIESGKVHRDDRVRISPSGLTTKVLSIEKFRDSPSEAWVGENVGLILENAVFVERGNIIYSQGLTFSDNFSATIFWLSKEDFNRDRRLEIRSATQKTTCKIEIKERIDSQTLEVVEKDSKILKNLEVARVNIKTKRPLAIKNFSELEELGRFVLTEDGNICAGGIITSV